MARSVQADSVAFRVAVARLNAAINVLTWITILLIAVNVTTRALRVWFARLVNAVWSAWVVPQSVMHCVSIWKTIRAFVVSALTLAVPIKRARVVFAR